MQIGIFAKTFPEIGAAKNLRAVKEAGFSCAQFNMACLGLPSLPDEISKSTIDDLIEARNTTGIEIAALSATYNMIHPNPSQRADGLKKLEAMLNAARSLNVQLVTLCTGSNDPIDQWKHHPENQSLQSWRTLCEEMTKAAVLAEKYKINLGIEPELANVVNSAIAARRLLDEMNSRRLRIVLDPVNLFEVSEIEHQHKIMADVIELLHDDIAMAHIKDRNAKSEFVAAGQGDVDFRFFIAQLKAKKFDGPLITHGLHANDANLVSNYLKGILM